MSGCNYIAGSWRAGANVLPVTNPYTGTDAGHLHNASPQDVTDAITCAAESFGQMRALQPYERAEILHTLCKGVEARAEEFAHCIACQAGKPLTQARAETARAITVLTLSSEEARRYGGETMPLDGAPNSARRIGITRRFAIGPVTAITPFNFPLNLGMHKVGPAIAVGAPVIWKPPPQAPGAAYMFADIAAKAGIPAGALQVVSAANNVAEQLVTNERVGVVSFTGSAGVGWRLRNIAGCKRVLLELGGNAAVIIDAQTDLPAAADRCVFGAFAYQGQVCISVQRILVEKSVYAQFVDLLVNGAKSLRAGDPDLDTTQFGPMISAAQADRVEEWVQAALHTGARALLMGNRTGLAVPPIILTDTSADMLVESEEVFGPVVTVNPFESWTEAIERVNGTKYGLQAGVFTPNLARALQAFEQLDVGAVIVNDVPTIRADNMPYGGVKQSGLGREGVRYAMDEITEIKLLSVPL